MSLEPGGTFGPYTVVQALGRGGMASVYKCYEAVLDRHIALKVLPREFLHEESFAERFRREAKVIARLEHPNIVPIHAFGIEENIPWMAMRFVSGGSLSSIMKGQQLPLPKINHVVKGVADALDYAHGKGVVHRDVKPQNILLDDDGRVYLADFGIAKMVEGSAALTQAGMISGTPQYMAPEQARGLGIDHRADIYALGIVAYELLTGHTPFRADTPVAVLMKHLQEPMPMPAPSQVPEAAGAVLLRCLAKEPGERWPTAAAFAEALEEGLKGSMPTLETPATAPAASELAIPTRVARPKPPPVVPVTSRRPVTLVRTGSVTPPPLPQVTPKGEGSTPRRAVIAGMLIGFGAFGLLALVAAGWLVFKGIGSGGTPRSPAPEASSSAPLPAAPETAAPAASGPPAATEATLPPQTQTAPLPPRTQPQTAPARGPAVTVPPPTVPPLSASEPPPSSTVAASPSTAPARASDGRFERTFPFVANAGLTLEAEIGPFRATTAQLDVQQGHSGRFKRLVGNNASVSTVKVLVQVQRQKNGADWDLALGVDLLDEGGRTVATLNDGFEVEDDKTTLTLLSEVPQKKMETVRAARFRLEGKPH